MLRNYLTVILQTIIRNKTFSLINVLGLSVGLAVFMIIIQYVRFEQSYDRFHAKADHIYRVILEYSSSDGIRHQEAGNHAPLAEALIKEFPEVQNVVRITPEYNKVIFSHENKIFEESKAYYTDSTFFTLFDFKLVDGDPRTALTDIGSIVLSRTTAEKYFGPINTWKESPLNQIILMNNTRPLKITGIMEDMPPNSHINANALMSFTTFLQYNDPHKTSQKWFWNDFFTYIELAPGTDHKYFESKLPALVARYKGKDMPSPVGFTDDRMIVQPLTEIHLYSNVGFELNPNGNAQAVYFLSVISIIILLIAWVNYINLSTARVAHRTREVGIRKVNGASRIELIIQFLLESFCVNFIALMFSIVIVAAVLPFISQILDKPLTLSLLNDNMFLFYTGVTYVVGSLVAGWYPAMMLSSYKPASIFKSHSSGMARGNSGLRQSLVILQFIISAGLITGTLIIENQMNFIRNKDLGYNHDNTIVLSASGTQGSRSSFFYSHQNLKAALLTYPEIENVTVSSALPGKSPNDVGVAEGLRMYGDSKEVTYHVNACRVDEAFIDVFDLKLIAGKNFSISYVDGLIGEQQLILNRKAAELFGYANPDDIIGKKIHFYGPPREIVGVVEDYHHKSPKNSLEPQLFTNRITNMGYITVRVKRGSGYENTIARLNQIWKVLFPNDPFVYYFLEDHVNDQFKADVQFKAIFGIFSGFSIFISCLGLFGLVSYTVSVRIREIGVRKVLGASIASIVVLFTQRYARLLLIACVIGIPLAFYVLQLWIDNFAYKADIGWLIFVVPVFTVALMACLAVTVQVVKAALMNPVNSLRTE